MVDTTPENIEGQEITPSKKSKKPLLIGVALAVLLGGGGFFAVQSGLILGAETDAHEEEAHEEKKPEGLPDIAFVPIDPLIISLGPNAGSRHLKFRAQLEVDSVNQSAVESVMPRVVDVLNGYLRAVDVKDLETPSALFKLRAQMLRRIQIVTGEGRVRDLLIMEFVLN